MTFKEYLISLGLDDAKATEVENGMADQKFYLAGEDNLDSRYAKAKAQRDQFELDLNTANDLVANLQKSNKDNAELQTQLADYKRQAEEATAKQADIAKEYAVKDALREAGAQDLDYMMFKLGEVEVDKDGNVKELESKVKALKEASPTFFTAPAPEGGAGDGKGPDDKTAGGYKPIDNKLDKGNGDTDPNASDLATLEAAMGIKH